MFRVAIPSYRRAETLKRKTLAFLHRHGIFLSQIDIFVASDAEEEEYRRVLGDEYHLVVGELGIHKQREFIHAYYIEGLKVLCMDDDVSNIASLYSGSGLRFVDMVEQMFAMAQEEGCRLWGVYPSADYRNMKDRVVKGRVYCIGALYGMRNWHGAVYPHQTTEDFTRTLLCEELDGAVLRFEGVAPVTRYFKEKGGLQEFRTPELQEYEMGCLVERWPEKVVLRKKHGVWVDVRFKRRVEKVTEAPFALEGVL